MVEFRAVLQAAKKALGIISIETFVERQQGPKWIEFYSLEAREANGQVHNDYMLRMFNTVVNCSLIRYAKKH